MNVESRCLSCYRRRIPFHCRICHYIHKLFYSVHACRLCNWRQLFCHGFSNLVCKTYVTTVLFLSYFSGASLNILGSCLQIDDKVSQLLISVKSKISKKRYCAYISILIQISQLTFFINCEISLCLYKGTQISQLISFH